MGRFVSSTSKVARAAGTVEVKAGRNLPKITQNIGTKGPNKALPSHAHKAAMHDVCMMVAPRACLAKVLK